MVDNGRKIDDLPVKTSAHSSDRILVFYNAANASTAQTATITVGNLMGNAAGFVMQTDPANNSILTVQAGTFFFSNSYGYYAIANNVLKRFTLSDF